VIADVISLCFVFYIDRRRVCFVDDDDVEVGYGDTLCFCVSVEFPHLFVICAWIKNIKYMLYGALSYFLW